MSVTRLWRRPLLIPALVLAFGAASTAQKPPAATAPPQGQKIRVVVDLVTTPAIVRDRKGQFLPDLRHDEFEVYEDGVRQAVVTFSLVHGGRMLNVAAPAPPPAIEGILLPPSRPTGDASGRVFLIFIDDLHLDPANTPRIRDLCRSIAKELIHEGDMFGVLSTGPSSIVIDLTYDRRRLDAAIERISGAGLSPRDILEVPLGAEGPPEVRHRAHVAFRTAYDLVSSLEKLHDRRKALIYVSNGYDLNPFSETRAKLDAQRQDGRTGDPDRNPFGEQSRFSEADLVSQLSELTRAANRANVTFYAIDPRGLGAGPDLSQPIDMVAWQNHVSRSQDTLRVLADQTGGIAVLNTNNYASALKQIDAATSDYYLLGYYSNNPDQAQRRRTIEVRVKRPGVDVRHRTEYSLKPPAR